MVSGGGLDPARTVERPFLRVLLLLSSFLLQFSSNLVCIPCILISTHENEYVINSPMITVGREIP